MGNSRLNEREKGSDSGPFSFTFMPGEWFIVDFSHAGYLYPSLSCPRV